jgi:hypothetical protein
MTGGQGRCCKSNSVEYSKSGGSPSFLPVAPSDLSCEQALTYDTVHETGDSNFLKLMNTNRFGKSIANA